MGARLETVVIIHGLWMTGVESTLLRHRLMNEFGYEARLFQYDTVNAGLDENLEKLEAFLADIDSRVIHLVGHSLGGVIALHTVMRNGIEHPGRVVCLGSPLLGSSVAGEFARWVFGSVMLGETARETLLERSLDRYEGDRDVGVIAGSLGVGLGQFLDPLPEPHDGTVAVEETRLPGITDHIVLPVSHTGLLISESVARQTAHFLRYGRFDHEGNDNGRQRPDG